MLVKTSFNQCSRIKLFCLCLIALTTSVMATDEPALLSFKKDLSPQQVKTVLDQAQGLMKEPKESIEIMDPILRNHWSKSSKILSKNISKIFTKLVSAQKFPMSGLQKMLETLDGTHRFALEKEHETDLMHRLLFLIFSMTKIEDLESLTGVTYSDSLNQALILGEMPDLACEATQRQLILRELLHRTHYFSGFCFTQLVDTRGEPVPLFGHIEDLKTESNTLARFCLFFSHKGLWPLPLGTLGWTPKVSNASVIKIDSSGLRILPLAIPVHLDPDSDKYLVYMPKNPLLHLMIKSKNISGIKEAKESLTGVKRINSNLKYSKNPFLSAYLTQSSNVMHLYHVRRDKSYEERVDRLKPGDAGFKETNIKYQEALNRSVARNYLLKIFEVEDQSRNKMEEIASQMKALMEEKGRIHNVKRVKSIDSKINRLRLEMVQHTKTLKKVSSEIKHYESCLDLYDYVITQALVDLSLGSTNLYDSSIELDPIEEAWVLPFFRQELSSVVKKQVSTYENMITKTHYTDIPPVPLQFLLPLPCEHEREQVVQLLELVYVKCCQSILKGQVMQMIKEQFGSPATVQEIEDEERLPALTSEAPHDLPVTTALDLLDSHQQNAPYARMTECRDSLDAVIENSMVELADKLIEPSSSVDAHPQTSAAQSSAKAGTSSASPFEELEELLDTDQAQNDHDEEEWIQLAREAEEAIRQEKAYSKQKKTSQKTKAKEEESDDSKTVSKKMQLKALLDIKETLEQSGKLKKGAKDVFRTVAEIMQRAKDMGLFKQVSTTRKGSHVSFHITHSLTKNNRQQDCGALVTIPCNKKEFGKGLQKAIVDQVQNALRLMRPKAEIREDQRSICEVKELQ